MKTNFNKLILSILFLANIGLVSCKNEIDNYISPEGGISGTIYDAETKEPIQLPVQGAAGVLVNLFEQNTGASKSIDFRANQDGTYQNAKVFNGDYKVVVNGPFVNKCEGNTRINGQTTLDLSAVPFSRISIDAVISADNNITINYKVDKTDSKFVLSNVSVMWNFAPRVDINNSNYAAISSKGAVASGSQLFELSKSAVFTGNIYKIKANGNKIYVRVCAKVNDAVNYSKVLELSVN
ncbi:DUF3823 domain-containing protein [Pedobacter nototheniae]|uniref:DUF3823 domain-containing protein n=1 Tax=Pedobacter nototheniae TaxID=2488994 RepID=UPI00103BA92C|nr:DUF3823 domain-containing protein [Pedobacter nototheniae]